MKRIWGENQFIVKLNKFEVLNERGQFSVGLSNFNKFDNYLNFNPN